MDAQATIANDLVQLLDPHLTTVILLKGTARNKSAVVDREYQCLKQLFVPRIKGDVDEDLISVAGHGFLLNPPPDECCLPLG